MARPDKGQKGSGGGAQASSTQGHGPSGLLLVAEVGAPHGVRGLVRLRVYTEDPRSLLQYPLFDKTGRKLELRHLQPGPKGMVAGFRGINDRNGAEGLKNLKIFTPRTSLPALEDEDDFYISDLIGLTVKDSDGSTVGTIRSVQNFGAGDLLDILTPDGKSDFLPFTKTFVPLVSITGAVVVIEPPLGFLTPSGPMPDGEEE